MAKKMKGCLVWVVILVVIMVVLVCTCPSADKHKKAISEEVNTAIGNVATENYGILGAVGSMLASGVVGVAVDEFVDVDDYVVCSVGKLYYDGDTTVVSVGVLNHIFTVNSEKIEKKIKDM